MTAIEVALRAVSYAATMLLFGASLFRVYAPVQIQRATSVRTLRGAAAAALLSGGLWLVIHTAVVSGESIAQVLASDTIGVAVRDTVFGRIAALRLVLLGLFCVMPSSGRADIVRVALAGCAIASMAWSGHAVGTPGNVHVLADMVHLLAAGAWVGGLIPFACVLARETSAEVATMTERFSRLGIGCVAALLVTGFVNAWFLVGRLDALLATPYGRLLSVKLALFALMLALAADNRVRLTSRLPEVSAARRIARNAAVEAALGLAVVLVVAVLGVTVPAAHTGIHMH